MVAAVPRIALAMVVTVEALSVVHDGGVGGGGNQAMDAVEAVHSESND